MRARRQRRKAAPVTVTYVVTEQARTNYEYMAYHAPNDRARDFWKRKAAGK